MVTRRHLSLNLRMSADEIAPAQQRAERLGISLSAATRELVELGAALEAGEQRGWMISDGVQGLVARREPLVFTIAPDPHDPAGPMWLVLPEEVAAHGDQD